MLPHLSRGSARTSERPASVSLLIASTVSGIESSLESAPIAPASIAQPATEVSRRSVMPPKAKAPMRAKARIAPPLNSNTSSGSCGP